MTEEKPNKWRKWIFRLSITCNIVFGLGWFLNYMNSPTYKLGVLTQDVNAGFIAEELYEQGFEEFVIKDSEDIPYSVPYGNIVALLTKGIQEQQATIESLTARLELLESKVV